jgi:hypothetical protein
MAQGVHEPAIPDDRHPDRLRQPGVEVAYAGDRPTVAVTGQVDRAKVSEVSGIVRGLLAVGVSDLVVDLTHAWDSAVLLTVLARTRADLADHGGTLRLDGVALPEFLAALTEAPLDEVFLVYDAVRRSADVGPAAGEAHPASSVRRGVDWSP